MRMLPVLPVLCFPGAAYAAEGTGAGGFSFVSGFFQMVASLSIVVGLIFLAYYLVNRFLKGSLVNKSVPRYIRVVESRFLAPKKSLMLVEVGGEYLLLGSSDSGLSLIKQVDMLETIEIVEELSATKKPAASFPDGFRFVMEMIQKGRRATIPGEKGGVRA
ncbi:MAG: flagellar biosynthetic protein FliO [Deltaproteobacteria bacterium]|nr:flagellar biosynthetic protein FliO [Deltaproteobacteria bacterium]TLN04818.1 MAG: flagellar biosynthetic protein FliO [bacterium]